MSVIQFTVLNKTIDYDNISQQLLTTRGMNSDIINHYLNVTEDDNLDPFLLDNMQEGIELLLRHLKDDKEIFVVVDSDADGFTSSAILLNYLHRFVPSIVESKISYGFHDGKTHGIDLSQISDGVGLVIAPDSSSDETDIHEQLHNRGIDVLVIDHHLTRNEDKYGVIINNQLCDYPTKGLTGAGVVLKFCQAFDSFCGLDLSNDLFDLAAVGIIADMSDLRECELRYILNKGLTNIVNPFLQGIIERNAYSIGKSLTPIGVAFYIAPFINAMNRSGTITQKQLLFESMLEWKAYNMISSTKRGCQGQKETLVTQAIRTCGNVKNQQTTKQDALVSQLRTMIEEQELYNEKIIILQTQDIDRNLAGLVANKFMAEFKRPVTILSPVTLDNNEIGWEGSARGFPCSAIPAFRTFCFDSGYAYLAGGHDNAFGLGILDKDMEAFKTYCQEQTKNMEITDEIFVDFSFNGNDIPRKVIGQIANLSYLWGQDLPEPQIAVEHFSVTKDKITLLSPDAHPTLKFNLGNGVTAIKFKSNKDEFDSLYSENGCVTISFIGTCDLNEFRGEVTPQIKINHLEIEDRQEYYF